MFQSQICDISWLRWHRGHRAKLSPPATKIPLETPALRCEWFSVWNKIIAECAMCSSASGGARKFVFYSNRTLWGGRTQSLHHGPKESSTNLPPDLLVTLCTGRAALSRTQLNRKPDLGFNLICDYWREGGR